MSGIPHRKKSKRFRPIEFVLCAWNTFCPKGRGHGRSHRLGKRRVAMRLVDRLFVRPTARKAKRKAKGREESGRFLSDSLW